MFTHALLRAPASCIGSTVGCSNLDHSKVVTVSVGLADNSVEIKISDTLRTFVVFFLRALAPKRGKSILAETPLVITTDGISDTGSTNKFNPPEVITIGPRKASVCFQEESEIACAARGGIVLWTFEACRSDALRAFAALQVTALAVGRGCATCLRLLSDGVAVGPFLARVVITVQPIGLLARNALGGDVRRTSSAAGARAVPA